MESYTVIKFKVVSFSALKSLNIFYTFYLGIQTVILGKKSLVVKIKMRLEKNFVLSEGYKVYKVIKNFSETFQKFSMYIC